MERASSASLSHDHHDEGGPNSPLPFAEAPYERSAETAERIRKASGPSSVRIPIWLSICKKRQLRQGRSADVMMLCTPLEVSEQESYLGA